MNAVINAMIIDDEPLACLRVENLLKEIKEINLVDVSYSGIDAIDKIGKLSPDLIFLDIQLKDMNGFEVINKLTLNKLPLIIFITAYNDYSIKAFEFFAFDYLLKPFKDERFYKSTFKAIEQLKATNSGYNEKLNMLIEFIENQKFSSIEKSANNIPVKLGNKIFFINFNEIKYIKASGYYAEIYIEARKHLIRESLTSLSKKLDKNIFFRIHRSAIINTTFVKEVITSNYGDMDVRMKDNTLLRISKACKKDFLKKMGVLYK